MSKDTCYFCQHASHGTNPCEEVVTYQVFGPAQPLYISTEANNREITEQCGCTKALGTTEGSE